MDKGKSDQLKKGDKVRLTPRGVRSFKLLGISEGGNLAFLQPMAFENHSRTEHAITWPKDDLIKVT